MGPPPELSDAQGLGGTGNGSYTSHIQGISLTPLKLYFDIEEVFTVFEY